MSIDIKALIKGNIDAFDEVYREYSPGLYNFIFSIVANPIDTQDILQNLFVKIWERRKEIDSEKNFKAYIYTIARHDIYNHIRNKMYLKVISDYELEFISNMFLFENSDIESELSKKDTLIHFREVINKLPERRREILIMNKIGNLSYKEIAKRLSISENTVDTQLRRAMSFLKKNLKPIIALIFLNLIK